MSDQRAGPLDHFPEKPDEYLVTVLTGNPPGSRYYETARALLDGRKLERQALAAEKQAQAAIDQARTTAELTSVTADLVRATRWLVVATVVLILVTVGLGLWQGSRTPTPAPPVTSSKS